VWQENRTCFSCHHQGLPIAVAALARSRGVAIDEALALKNVRVGLRALKSLDRAVQAADQIDPGKDEASLLVAGEDAGVPDRPAAELRQLLDGGLDANSRTDEGTSLLMMAGADLDKVSALLARRLR
jgi:hypothetical protein